MISAANLGNESKKEKGEGTVLSSWKILEEGRGV